MFPERSSLANDESVDDGIFACGDETRQPDRQYRIGGPAAGKAAIVGWGNENGPLVAGRFYS